jgi:hypothetical protein
MTLTSLCNINVDSGGHLSFTFAAQNYISLADMLTNTGGWNSGLSTVYDQFQLLEVSLNYVPGYRYNYDQNHTDPTSPPAAILYDADNVSLTITNSRTAMSYLTAKAVCLSDPFSIDYEIVPPANDQWYDCANPSSMQGQISVLELITGGGGDIIDLGVLIWRMKVKFRGMRD